MKNPLTAAQRDLLKTLRFPGGKETRYEDGQASWWKSGGHAGGTIVDRTAAAAVAAGFRAGPRRDASTPDASRVGGGTMFINDAGDVLSVTSSYGVTAYENRYSLTLVFCKAPAATPEKK